VHDLARSEAAQVQAFFDQPSQVAVGKDAQHAAFGADNGRRAQPLGAHFPHQIAEPGARADARHRVPGAHHVGQVGEQLAAERPARMRAREIFAAKTARIQQRHGQRIAQCELGRGAGRRREVERAGLFFDAAVQHDIGMQGQGGFAPAGHGNKRHPQALEHRQDQRHLVAFAAVGDRQHQVFGGDHAQVAVAGLGRVHEQRWRAGGGQRGGDLAPDVAALAHAHHHNPAAQQQDLLHGPRERVAGARLQPGHGGRFDVESHLGQAQGLGRVESLAGGLAEWLDRRRRRRRGGRVPGNHGAILSSCAPLPC